MKSSALLTALLITASSLALSGCAHRHEHGHHAATPNATAPAAAGAMSQGSKMDRTAMCEHYSRMPPEERRARMQAHHGNMSPEMLDQHEKMMRDKCAQSN